MSETIKIEKFPVEKLGAAREALEALHGKLVKAAAKAGATVPAVPTFVTSDETFDAKCTVCKTHYAGDLVAAGPVECPKAANEDGCDGVLLPYPLVTLEVTAGRPALAGWEFLAVVEPFAGGNMVRRVPGSDETVDLTGYRTGDALSCDHCNTVRARSETFVVRSDGSDPSVPAGLIKRVGRNCLSHFLGGKSPAHVLLLMTFERALKEAAGGEGGGWGRGRDVYGTVEFLSWTCAIVRCDGWMSKSAAAAYNEKAGDAGNKVPTVDKVHDILNPPRSARELARWREKRETYKPTDADKEKVGKVLEWARALNGASDYEFNLGLHIRGDTFETRFAGLVASAVGSYDRAMGAALKKATEDAMKVAAPTGKGIEFEGEVIKTSVTHSEEWGSTERMTVKVTTPAGVWFAWGSIPSHLCNLRSYNGAEEPGACIVDGYINRDDLVGRKVKIKALLESGKEPHFVFMKRPSVEFIDWHGPTPKAPKKAKAKKPATEAA